MLLNSTCCLVTGANGTTGRAICDYLLEQGATVIGTIRPTGTTAILTKRGIHRYQIEMDPLKRESVERAINTVIKELGQLQVLINVIGGFDMGKTVENYPPAKWEQLLDLNFKTALNTTQTILPHFKENSRGRLINFGSAAVENGLALAGPYLVSKAAVQALTRATAAELDTDITCNAVLPGTIDTPANREAMPDADWSTWVTPEKIAEAIAHFITGSSNGALIRLD